MTNPAPERTRLAELLAGLSLVTDLARGHAPEEAVRACALATGLARSMSLGDGEVRDVYFTTLLRYVGCTATSHEYARALGGDDVAVRRVADMLDTTDPREAATLLLSLGRSAPTPLARARTIASAAPRARRVAAQGARADCEVAAQMARRLDLDPGVGRALGHIFERWDGRGGPRRLRGERITLAARCSAVAFAGVMFADAGGPDAAVEVVRRWSGRSLDPAMAAAFAAEGPGLLAGIDEDPWTAVLGSEPAPVRFVSERGLDEAAAAFADAVDLKSTYLLGHSAKVADLAQRAAGAMGLDDDQRRALWRAGLLHDLGRAGVPTGVWDRPGPLTVADWEQVRLHAYHTERILARTPALQPVARLAGMHHERIDASGYHRQATPGEQSSAARILAAADVCAALTEDRPHRPAFGLDRAARILQQEPLDPPAVAAVLEAAGHATRVRAAWPAGLTDREVEVLRALARGASKREVARALFISPSTAHTHVVHIYEKLGVSTRAAAALFAMEHGLLHD
ncbi:MAG TPA: HD domain-containing phosphohydrolase [Actinomycetota bacterium]|jgi:HD-GYP domain-containing protein (c-di-GMP phosphodiesterase class II)